MAGPVSAPMGSREVAPPSPAPARAAAPFCSQPSSCTSHSSTPPSAAVCLLPQASSVLIPCLAPVLLPALPLPQAPLLSQMCSNGGGARTNYITGEGRCDKKSLGTIVLGLLFKRSENACIRDFLSFYNRSINCWRLNLILQVLITFILQCRVICLLLSSH